MKTVSELLTAPVMVRAIYMDEPNFSRRDMLAHIVKMLDNHEIRVGDRTGRYFLRSIGVGHISRIRGSARRSRAK